MQNVVECFDIIYIPFSSEGNILPHWYSPTGRPSCTVLNETFYSTYAVTHQQTVSAKKIKLRCYFSTETLFRLKKYSALTCILLSRHSVVWLKKYLALFLPSKGSLSFSADALFLTSYIHNIFEFIATGALPVHSRIIRSGVMAS